MRQFLGRFQYEVGWRAEWRHSFALARQCVSDLIILDLGLPGQDGWTVARELRADPAVDEVPILVITANISGATNRLGPCRVPGDHEQAIRA